MQIQKAPGPVRGNKLFFSSSRTSPYLAIKVIAAGSLYLSEERVLETTSHAP